MSKRYGRNQKRQHRERIAELERQIDQAKARAANAVMRANKAVDSLEVLKREVERWDKEIARILGGQSALRKDVASMESRHPVRELPVFPRASVAFSDYGEVTKRDIAGFALIMNRYVVEIQRHAPTLELAVRLKETNHGQTVAYVVSRELVRDLGFGEIDRIEIANMIAGAFVDLLNSDGSRAA